MGNIKTLKDARNGEVSLEEVWQPIWDTVEITKPGQYVFFQVPQKYLILGNLETAGEFKYPKRYSVHGFKVVFSQDVQKLIPHLMLEFVIGEKVYFRAPLSLFNNLSLNGYSLYLSSMEEILAKMDEEAEEEVEELCNKNQYAPVSLWIPTVQHFRATLVVEDCAIPEPFHALVSLMGNLYREIC